jgi:hypothetical protein
MVYAKNASITQFMKRAEQAEACAAELRKAWDEAADEADRLGAQVAGAEKREAALRDALMMQRRESESLDLCLRKWVSRGRPGGHLPANRRTVAIVRHLLDAQKGVMPRDDCKCSACENDKRPACRLTDDCGEMRPDGNVWVCDECGFEATNETLEGFDKQAVLARLRAVREARGRWS